MGNPFPYDLCRQTVTVYTKTGDRICRRVAKNCYYQWYDARIVNDQGTHKVRKFLLIQPGKEPIAPGDKIVPGEGPEISPEKWDAFLPAKVRGLGEVAYAQPWYWDGHICHYEAGRK